MPKAYPSFIQLTRRDEVAGLSELSLVNVDHIVLVRELADGAARVFFVADPFLSQFIDPVETYSYLVGLLTEMAPAADPPVLP